MRRFVRLLKVNYIVASFSDISEKVYETNIEEVK